MRYSKKVKKLQNIQSTLIIICLLAIAVFFIFRFKPEITEYDVEDVCGPIGGAISHSIDDEDACRNACSAKCLSFEKEYHDSDFFENTLEGCHTCTCYCKG